MSPLIYPKILPKLFPKYKKWISAQGLSPETFRTYRGILKFIAEMEIPLEDIFSDPNIKGKKMKVSAYRSWLRFLAVQGEITKADLADLLDNIKAIKQRGIKTNHRLAIPYEEWPDKIKAMDTRVGKMGVWLGFHFGLRLGELSHLRVEDIDSDNLIINICSQSKTKHQDAWMPKYNRHRTIPITPEQLQTIHSFIKLYRSPANPSCPYLLWTERGKTKGKILGHRAFQRYCRKVGLYPHALRYSFATHYYGVSLDIKLISVLLGHANVSTTSEYLALGSKESMDKARDLFSKK